MIDKKTSLMDRQIDSIIDKKDSMIDRQVI